MQHSGRKFCLPWRVRLQGVLSHGANDRFLTSGLDNGIDFNISTFDRYPKFAELLATLPDERPAEFEEYHERPFFTRGDAEWMFRQAWLGSRSSLLPTW